VARTPRLSSEASATKLEEGSRPILRLLSLSNGGTPQRLIPRREGRSHKTKSVADTPTPKVYLQYCAVVLAGVARSSSTNGAKANASKQPGTIGLAAITSPSLSSQVNRTKPKTSLVPVVCEKLGCLDGGGGRRSSSVLNDEESIPRDRNVERKPLRVTRYLIRVRKNFYSPVQKGYYSTVLRTSAHSNKNKETQKRDIDQSEIQSAATPNIK
jgi:hypothetical protein